MEKNILNLTQHVASVEQEKIGVFEPSNKDEVRKWLNFDEIPDVYGISVSAKQLAEIAEKELKSWSIKYVMIGGAPFLMSMLENQLNKRDIIPLYAFSKRVVEEKDGVKKSVFKHLGFVEMSDV